MARKGPYLKYAAKNCFLCGGAAGRKRLRADFFIFKMIALVLLRQNIK
jgi:hypothetical protein